MLILGPSSLILEALISELQRPAVFGHCPYDFLGNTVRHKSRDFQRDDHLCSNKT